MTQKKIHNSYSDDEDLKALLREKWISWFGARSVAWFITGIFLVLFAVFLLIACVSYFSHGMPDQSVLDGVAIDDIDETMLKESSGAYGSFLARFLVDRCFGWAALLLVPLVCAIGLHCTQSYHFRLPQLFLKFTVPMLWLSVLLSKVPGLWVHDILFYHVGGQFGEWVANKAIQYIGWPGLALALLLVAIVYAVCVAREYSMNAIRSTLHPSIRKKGTTTPDTDNQDDEELTEGPSQSVLQPDIAPEPAPEPDLPIQPAGNTPAENHASGNGSGHPVSADDIDMTIEVTTDKPNGHSTAQPVADEHADLGGNNENGEEEVLEPYNPRLDLEFYKFPTLDLLKDYGEQVTDVDAEEQNANKRRIVNVLRSFGIEISSIKASIGPTITLYEITPAEGIRISKIRNLEDDIALSLAALGIRIIAPMPGKGTIGIEVPNTKPQIVPMRTILADEKFQHSHMELPLALGKTITNELFMVDLAKAPHLLVAGATGMGKSVGLNAILASLIYKKHPAELKFVIIDPKKVEFSVYEPIEKHFLAKLPDQHDAIITDVKDVERTLNSLCIEMDQRYDLLRLAGCRNLKEYNAKFLTRRLNPEHGHHFMPYIVVVIDEFGDLIMTSGKNVELPICRIAQLARAVGIHAIIATQRPTTNIITGTIKANFPARIAFRTTALVDSRIILDRAGAQQLVGRGDMLYLQGNEPIRVQCAFIDTPEVENLANFVASQQGYPEAFALPEVPNDDDGGSNDVDLTQLDPMFAEAAEIVVSTQQGSASMIQRKLSVGFNRAGRIMDQLEKAGIVGPALGSKPREVYVTDVTELDNIIKKLRQ